MYTFEQACDARQTENAKDLKLNKESLASLAMFKKMATLGLLTN